jgi:hypothetical protein
VACQQAAVLLPAMGDKLQPAARASADSNSIEQVLAE